MCALHVLFANRLTGGRKCIMSHGPVITYNQYTALVKVVLQFLMQNQLTEQSYRHGFANMYNTVH